MLPKIVKLELESFSLVKREAFRQEYNRKKKSVATGYFFLLLLGWHYAYVNKWGLQILCFISLWGFFLWWIIDWFRLPSIINNYNKDVAIKIINQMK